MRLRGHFRLLPAMFVLIGYWAPGGSIGRTDEPASPEQREIIGMVLDKPVYRDQLRRKESAASELRELFAMPVMVKYRKKHEAELKPTPAEIDAAAAFFDAQHRERIKDQEPELREELKAVEAELDAKELDATQRQELTIKKRRLEVQLKPPGKPFAEFMLGNWKFQRHLYDNFGGGRILWQQAGIEAYDAMRTWLEAQEKKGEIKFTDPAVRTKIYEYWTTQKHGPFLTSDVERIRREFLEPEWAPRKRK